MSVTSIWKDDVSDEADADVDAVVVPPLDEQAPSARRPINANAELRIILPLPLLAAPDVHCERTHQYGAQFQDGSDG